MVLKAKDGPEEVLRPAVESLEAQLRRFLRRLRRLRLAKEDAERSAVPIEGAARQARWQEHGDNPRSMQAIRDENQAPREAMPGPARSAGRSLPSRHSKEDAPPLQRLAPPGNLSLGDLHGIGSQEAPIVIHADDNRSRSGHSTKVGERAPLGRRGSRGALTPTSASATAALSFEGSGASTSSRPPPPPQPSRSKSRNRGMQLHGGLRLSERDMRGRAVPWDSRGPPLEHEPRDRRNMLGRRAELALNLPPPPPPPVPMPTDRGLMRRRSRDLPGHRRQDHNSEPGACGSASSRRRSPDRGFPPQPGPRRREDMTGSSDGCLPRRHSGQRRSRTRSREPGKRLPRQPLPQSPSRLPLPRSRSRDRRARIPHLSSSSQGPRGVDHAVPTATPGPPIADRRRTAPGAADHAISGAGLFSGAGAAGAANDSGATASSVPTSSAALHGAPGPSSAGGPSTGGKQVTRDDLKSRVEALVARLPPSKPVSLVKRVRVEGPGPSSQPPQDPTPDMRNFGHGMPPPPQLQDGRLPCASQADIRPSTGDRAHSPAATGGRPRSRGRNFRPRR